MLLIGIVDAEGGNGVEGAVAMLVFVGGGNDNTGGIPGGGTKDGGDAVEIEFWLGRGGGCGLHGIAG